MIGDYQKFVLPDKKEGKGLVAEVNWDQNDTNTNECKIIKFTLPDGKEIFVERKHLNEILFAIGNPEDQRKLLPQKLETVHQRTVKLGIKAEKNIKKGETINLRPIDISIPCTYIREIIGSDAWNKEVQRFQKKGLWINPV